MKKGIILFIAAAVSVFGAKADVIKGSVKDTEGKGIAGVVVSDGLNTTVTDAKFVGISNYIRAFTESGDFLNALWFTIRFAAAAIISVNIFANYNYGIINIKFCFL